MIAYASRTGTRRNLDALRRAGWHLLVSAQGALRTEGFPYALENGAWSAYQKQQPFDTQAFAKALDTLGDHAEWVVVPDIVAGGHASLSLSLQWLPRVQDACRMALLAVQDGFVPQDVRPVLGANVGIFVGGSTSWKEATLPLWGHLAREVGCWLHVGRVNSARRILLCAAAGADSFDGTSVTRFSVTLRPLDYARKQLALFVT